MWFIEFQSQLFFENLGSGHKPLIIQTPRWERIRDFFRSHPVLAGNVYETLSLKISIHYDGDCRNEGHIRVGFSCTRQLSHIKKYPIMQICVGERTPRPTKICKFYLKILSIKFWEINYRGQWTQSYRLLILFTIALTVDCANNYKSKSSGNNRTSKNARANI